MIGIVFLLFIGIVFGIIGIIARCELGCFFFEGKLGSFPRENSDVKTPHAGAGVTKAVSNINRIIAWGKPEAALLPPQVLGEGGHSSYVVRRSKIQQQQVCF